MRNSIIRSISCLYSVLVPAIIVWLLISIICFFLSNRKMEKKQYLYSFITICYILFVFNITGVINSDFKFKWFKEALHNIYFDVPNSIDELKMVLLNVIMFIPLGILFPMIYKKANMIHLIFISLLLSVIIEFSQMFTGRFTDFMDIIANIVGMVIGFLIASIVTKTFAFFRGEKA